MKLSQRGTILWAAAFTDLFIVDRILKHFALKGAEASIAGDALAFKLFRNHGIAFSLDLSGPIVWITTIGILAFAVLMARRDVRERSYARLPAYGFFLFGTCSNLFDRVVYGFTVDYLIFFGRSAVNLADGMILFGALWLIARERKG